MTLRKEKYQLGNKYSSGLGRKVYKRDAERLKNPITFYKYVKGKDALGTFSFSIQNYSEISSYNTFRTYEKCREELVKSLIDDYKKLKIK